jgi:RNase P/RNase MRP subunit p30
MAVKSAVKSAVKFAVKFAVQLATRSQTHCWAPKPMCHDSTTLNGGGSMVGIP